MSKKLLPAVVFFMAMALLFASCGDDQNKLMVNEGVAARIGDKKVTDEYVDEIFESLSESQKNEYKGPRGRARLVDLVINDELIYLEAKNRNLANDPEVKQQIELATRRILISAYYTKAAFEKIEISDEEVEKYYNDNKEKYTNRGVYKGQHVFSADSMKCVEWKKRVEKGEKLSAIAKSESEDESTRETFGSLGYFNPDGFIKFYGVSKRFADQVRQLEVGQVSDVISTEKGYSLVRLSVKNPETVAPLSEVSDDIREFLRRGDSEAVMDQEVERLRKKYNPVNYAQEKILNTTRSPEELWKIAQAEDAPYTRILYYRELVDRYPDHEFAAQALFMIGFVYSEELLDFPHADLAFAELLKKYPDSEVAGSAKWMRENLYKKHPKFESIESIQKEIDKESE